MVKVITVNKEQSLSLQYHHRRDEYWVALSGEGTATIGDEKKPFLAGETRFVPRETKHRIESGPSPLVFLELSFGEFNENDIVRLEDKYGRANTKNGS